MDLLNETPFAADRFLLAGADGREMLLLVVRATYQVAASGKVALALEQTPPAQVDTYLGPPGRSSVASASDLAWSKPQTDVVVTGYAYTQKESRFQALVALKVGNLVKSIRVVGDRTWKRGLLGWVPSDPLPFLKLPLIYERAYGGTDTGQPEGKSWHPANPVGVGFVTSKTASRLAGTPVPNLEDPRSPIEKADAQGVPLSLGPVAPFWAPRAGFAGTYSERWREERMPLLPSDFDPRFFQVVPADQQLPRPLQGGEEVRIAGMRPEGLLQFRVPSVRVSALVESEDGEFKVPLSLDTLNVDCEGPTFALVWRGTWNAHQRTEGLGAIRFSCELPT